MYKQIFILLIVLMLGATPLWLAFFPLFEDDNSTKPTALNENLLIADSSQTEVDALRRLLRNPANAKRKVKETSIETRFSGGNFAQLLRQEAKAHRVLGVLSDINVGENDSFLSSVTFNANAFLDSFQTVSGEMETNRYVEFQTLSDRDEIQHINDVYSKESALLKAAIAKRTHEIYPCFDALASQVGTSIGKIEVRIDIKQKGRIKRVELLGNTFDNDVIAQCIVSTILSWKKFKELSNLNTPASVRQIYTLGQ